MGINLIKAVLHTVKIEKELEKELQFNKGWLKLSKLNEFTSEEAIHKFGKEKFEHKKRQKSFKNSLTDFKNRLFLPKEPTK